MPESRKLVRNLSAESATSTEDEVELAAPPDVQEALGVTTDGNCARHPSCPVLSLKHNKVMPCRVCFSEEKSVGIRQRKSFAAVVQQLQQKKDDDDSISITSKDDPDAAEERRRKVKRAHSASMQDLILQQPQTLDAVMKRTAQVQNWLLRQKEKEVTSLQLRIQALEQSLHDSEAQNQENRQTIWALRRTIQQDMKIIKTMAVQKEREMGAHLESPMNSSAASSPSKRSSYFSHTDSPSLGSPEKIRQRGLNSLSANSTPMTSPDGKGILSSGPNTPDAAISDVDTDNITPEAMRGIVLDGAGNGSGDPLLDMVRQKKKALQSKFEELRAANSNRPIPTKTVSSHQPARSSMSVLKRSDGMPLQRQSSLRSLEDMVEPPQMYAVKDPDKQGVRKPYFNDESDPTKTFASFRGGLLDVPKSPPAASNDNRQKNRPKLHLDNDQMNQLKMPRMRGIGRTLSDDGMSFDALSIGSESAGQRDGLHGIANSLHSLSLARPMSDDNTDHMAETSSRHGEFDERSTASASSDAQPPISPSMSAVTPSSARKPKRTLSTDEILDVVVEGHNEDEDLGASKGNFSFTPPIANDDAEENPGKDNEQKEIYVAPQPSPSPVQKKPPAPGKPATKPSSAYFANNVMPKDDETIDTTPTFFTESAASAALSGEQQKAREEEQFLFQVTSAESQDKYGDSGMYTGTILVTQGMPHGKGCMNYENGRVYNGDWVSGQWHGQGKLLNPNGDTYEGEFVLDARHGKGEYRWDNGDVYTGDFSYDRRSGNGKFCFHNGNVYEGEFVDGMFEGFGRYEFNGGYYEGEWRQGRYHGDGELSHAHGGKYTGQFRESLAHGFGVEQLPDGSKRRGVWELGQLVQLFNTRPSGAQSVGSSTG